MQSTPSARFSPAHGASDRQCYVGRQAFKVAYFFLTGLRTRAESQLQLVQDRWSIEDWQWIRDAQFHKNAHH